MTPVAVNLLWCVPGQVGGSEDYLVRQLLGLAELEHRYQVTAYVPQGFAEAHPDLAERQQLVIGPVDGRSRPRRVAAEHGWLARATAGAALVHHGGGTAPARGPRPIVLTIHDLQWRTYPGYVSPVKRAYLRRAVPRAVGRAAVVAVPSSYVRGTVVEAFGMDAERVVVVPHGVEAHLERDATPADVLRQRHRLGPGPVLVYPAMTHPHKNHRFLLRLMAERWTDPDLRLVLIGGEGSAEPEVRAAIDAGGLAGRVVRPGRVSHADRDGLLAMADALVFPSEYEGFGAPVIEAMSLGTPVIASDRTSLPEVVGDAGLVAPLDLDAWAGALDEVHARRAELVDAGRARVESHFTAVRSAAALLDAYGLALA